MQAYEFYAKPKDGVIAIPEKYKHRITTEVKVIVLEEDRSKQKRDMMTAQDNSDLLLPPTMDTKGWRFNREEANER